MGTNEAFEPHSRREKAEVGNGVAVGTGRQAGTGILGSPKRACKLLQGQRLHAGNSIISIGLVLSMTIRFFILLFRQC